MRQLVFVCLFFSHLATSFRFVSAGIGNAFVRYQTLDMAHRAKVELSGQYIGKFQCKIGYGKATPTTRIWVGGLGAWTSVTQLEREFDRFGAIKKIEYNKGDTQAYILYDSIDAAMAAVKEMHGFPLGAPDRRIRIDFADNGTTPSFSKRSRGFEEGVSIVAAPTTNIRKAVHHTRKIHHHWYRNIITSYVYIT
ncbi:RNA-binding protein spenito-like [Armigeres subalbatus]|uniref:RNA-binding protein spenito-like n=1 Tax=Armigeres subalbatus TaxID=124917 RepID=UPI002ED46ABA